MHNIRTKHAKLTLGYMNKWFVRRCSFLVDFFKKRFILHVCPFLENTMRIFLFFPFLNRFIQLIGKVSGNSKKLHKALILKVVLLNIIQTVLPKFRATYYNTPQFDICPRILCLFKIKTKYFSYSNLKNRKWRHFSTLSLIKIFSKLTITYKLVISETLIKIHFYLNVSCLKSLIIRYESKFNSVFADEMCLWIFTEYVWRWPTFNESGTIHLFIHNNFVENQTWVSFNYNLFLFFSDMYRRIFLDMELINLM